MNFHLHDINTVHVRYFNSRGGFGARFSEVKLKDHELRPSRFLHKGRNALVPVMSVPDNSTVGVVNSNISNHHLGKHNTNASMATKVIHNTNTKNKADVLDTNNLKESSSSMQGDQFINVDNAKLDTDLW